MKLYDDNNSNCFFDVISGKSNIYSAVIGTDIPSGLG